jgi:anti-sigma B factor antagonist
MRAPLFITQRTIGDVVLLDLRGRLVFDEGDEVLRERVTSLVQAGSTRLLVGLKNVTHIDSGGVAALVAMFLHVIRRGGQFKLLCPSACATRVLGITRLTPVFEIFEDEAIALASFEHVSA